MLIYRCEETSLNGTSTYGFTPSFDVLPQCRKAQECKTVDFPIPDSESGLSKPFQAEDIKELEFVDYTCVEKGPEWSLLGEYKPGQDFSFDSNAEIIDGRLRIHCAIGGILGEVYLHEIKS